MHKDLLPIGLERAALMATFPMYGDVAFYFHRVYRRKTNHNMLVFIYFIQEMFTCIGDNVVRLSTEIIACQNETHKTNEWVEYKLQVKMLISRLIT